MAKGMENCLGGKLAKCAILGLYWGLHWVMSSQLLYVQFILCRYFIIFTFWRYT